MATEVNGARDVLILPGLTGHVRTRYWAKPGDGAGQDWAIQDEEPTGVLGRMSLPTVDGRWAVPTSFAASPPRGPLAGACLRDVMRRALTFRDEGGTDLLWVSDRPGPGLSRQPVHSSQPKPHPVSCSHFTGMVTAGWEYRSTTYVADQNSRTGWYVPYGAPIGPGQELVIWQACLSAQTFFTMGDVWASDGTDIAAGDILFFSEHDPEKSWKQVRAGTKLPYFGNVYHTALYLGGGSVIQAATPTSPTGVYARPLAGLSDTLSLVARPRWAPPAGTGMSVWIDGYETPL